MTVSGTTWFLPNHMTPQNFTMAPGPWTICGLTAHPLCCRWSDKAYNVFCSRGKLSQVSIMSSIQFHRGGEGKQRWVLGPMWWAMKITLREYLEGPLLPFLENGKLISGLDSQVYAKEALARSRTAWSVPQPNPGQCSVQLCKQEVLPYSVLCGHCHSPRPSGFSTGHTGLLKTLCSGHSISIQWSSWIVSPVPLFLHGNWYSVVTCHSLWLRVLRGGFSNKDL